MHRTLLALAILLAVPSTTAAQSTRTIEMGVERGLADALGPPLGVLAAILVGVGDLYAVGVGVERAIEQGDGLPARYGGLELAASAMHVFAGAMLTWAGVEDDDAGFLAIGIPALAFGAWYLVHGIYSLADPGHDPPRARGPDVSVGVAPTRDGGALLVAGRF
ncbi:MAG: hypothetical protein R3B82_01380 [Sandaracinaceae bacterium]